MLLCFGQSFGPVPLNAALAPIIWHLRDFGLSQSDTPFDPQTIFGDSLRVKVFLAQFGSRSADMQ